MIPDFINGNIDGEVFADAGTLYVNVTSTPRYSKHAIIHKLLIIDKELHIECTRIFWVQMTHHYLFKDELDVLEDVDKVEDEYTESTFIETKKWSWRKLKYIVTATRTKSIKKGWVKLKERKHMIIRTSVYHIQK